MSKDRNDASRIEQEKIKQQRFPRGIPSSTVPSWYRGEAQVAILMLRSGGHHLLLLDPDRWRHLDPMVLDRPRPPAWQFHRMGRPIAIYCMAGSRASSWRSGVTPGCTHHYFTHHNMLYKGPQGVAGPSSFRPMPWSGSSSSESRPALLVGYLWSPNLAYIIVGSMAANYLVYEGLHTVSHLDDARHPYLKYVPLVNTVRRMHRAHHNLRFMQTHNFNLTWPIADAIMGTSDLNRGLIGTLFNGENETYAMKDPRLEAEPPQFHRLGNEIEQLPQGGTGRAGGLRARWRAGLDLGVISHLRERGAVPRGVAVDTSRGKLFHGKGRGSGSPSSLAPRRASGRPMPRPWPPTRAKVVVADLLGWRAGRQGDRATGRRGHLPHHRRDRRSLRRRHGAGHRGALRQGRHPGHQRRHVRLAEDAAVHRNRRRGSGTG